MVERLPRLQEVAGWIPCQVIPNTLEMVVMATLLGAQGCGAQQLTGRGQPLPLFGMTRLGIKHATSRTRGGRSTTTSLRR